MGSIWDFQRALDGLAKSKKEGGLGLRDIQSFNDALLAKVSWRILLNPSCLVAKILLGKLCKDQPFLETKTVASASHCWGSVIIGKDLLKSQLGRAFGNGKDTSLWNDSWLSLNQPEKPMGSATL
ncbi:uncharacterized protein LOC112089663 [Eutrema salsugineum]|uniref:uncharacterized protein LOC112089663 n=1 Tax=Eutrema salsugineum TaxID=72664 RepID=UPI000CED53F9|nr:uncharacterized protein LOC112089663 [Eutrema salsugineum]